MALPALVVAGAGGIALEPIALFGVFLIFAVGMIAWTQYQAKVNTERWNAVAAESGLSSQGRWPVMTMEGELAGVPVLLRQWTTTSGSGKNKKTRTHVHARARIGRTIGDVVVFRQTWMSDLGKLVFSNQDVEVGDPEFDPHFMVKATDVEAAKRVLDPPTRRALLDTRRMLGDVGIEENAVTYRQEGGITGDRAIEILLALSTCSVSLGAA